MRFGFASKKLGWKLSILEKTEHCVVAGNILTPFLCYYFSNSQREIISLQNAIILSGMHFPLLILDYLIYNVFREKPLAIKLRATYGGNLLLITIPLLFMLLGSVQGATTNSYNPILKGFEDILSVDSIVSIISIVIAGYRLSQTFDVASSYVNKLFARLSNVDMTCMRQDLISSDSGKDNCFKKNQTMVAIHESQHVRFFQPVHHFGTNNKRNKGPVLLNDVLEKSINDEEMAEVYVKNAHSFEKSIEFARK